MALVVKNPPVNIRDTEKRAESLGREDSLEEGMATHSSILGSPGGSDGKESACK